MGVLALPLMISPVVMSNTATKVVLNNTLTAESILLKTTENNSVVSNWSSTGVVMLIQTSSSNAVKMTVSVLNSKSVSEIKGCYFNEKKCSHRYLKLCQVQH